MTSIARDWSVQHFNRRRRHQALRRALAGIGIVAAIAGAIVVLAYVAVPLR